MALPATGSTITMTNIRDFFVNNGFASSYILGILGTYIGIATGSRISMSDSFGGYSFAASGSAFPTMKLTNNNGYTTPPNHSTIVNVAVNDNPTNYTPIYTRPENESPLPCNKNVFGLDVYNVGGSNIGPVMVHQATNELEIIKLDSSGTYTAPLYSKFILPQTFIKPKHFGTQSIVVTDSNTNYTWKVLNTDLSDKFDIIPSANSSNFTCWRAEFGLPNADNGLVHIEFNGTSTGVNSLLTAQILVYTNGNQTERFRVVTGGSDIELGDKLYRKTEVANTGHGFFQTRQWQWDVWMTSIFTAEDADGNLVSTDWIEAVERWECAWDPSSGTGSWTRLTYDILTPDRTTGGVSDKFYQINEQPPGYDNSYQLPDSGTLGAGPKILDICYISDILSSVGNPYIPGARKMAVIFQMDRDFDPSTPDDKAVYFYDDLGVTDDGSGTAGTSLDNPAWIYRLPFSTSGAYRTNLQQGSIRYNGGTSSDDATGNIFESCLIFNYTPLYWQPHHLYDELPGFPSDVFTDIIDIATGKTIETINCTARFSGVQDVGGSDEPTHSGGFLAPLYTRASDAGLNLPEWWYPVVVNDENASLGTNEETFAPGIYGIITVNSNGQTGPVSYYHCTYPIKTPERQVLYCEVLGGSSGSDYDLRVVGDGVPHGLLENQMVGYFKTSSSYVAGRIDENGRGTTLWTYIRNGTSTENIQERGHSENSLIILDRSRPIPDGFTNKGQLRIVDRSNGNLRWMWENTNTTGFHGLTSAIIDEDANRVAVFEPFNDGDRAHVINYSTGVLINSYTGMGRVRDAVKIPGTTKMFCVGQPNRNQANPQNGFFKIFDYVSGTTTTLHTFTDTVPIKIDMSSDGLSAVINFQPGFGQTDNRRQEMRFIRSLTGNYSSYYDTSRLDGTRFDILYAYDTVVQYNIQSFISGYEYQDMIATFIDDEKVAFKKGPTNLRDNFYRLDNHHYVLDTVSFTQYAVYNETFGVINSETPGNILPGGIPKKFLSNGDWEYLSIVPDSYLMFTEANPTARLLRGLSYGIMVNKSKSSPS